MILRSFFCAFFIVFVFVQCADALRIDASQNYVDETATHQSMYDRRGNIINRRNYFAMQRSAVVNLTGLGILQGSIDETKWTRTHFYKFLGVKYAESPSGNRRFKVN